MNIERNGRKLKLLNEDDAHNAVVDLISEIKLITGAFVYDGNMMKAQVEMLKRFLVTGFGMLSKEEIVESFYMNHQGVFDEVYVHYNRELNAEFTGNVLRAFLKWKAGFLREKRDRIIGILAPIKMPERDIDYDFWKVRVQEDLNILQFKSNEISMWHQRKYYTLRKFGLMPFKGISSWFYFIRKALISQRWHLYLPAKTDMSKYKFVTINQVYLLFKNPDDFKLCVEVARKFAYWYILNACAECGVNNLWKDIKA